MLKDWTCKELIEEYHYVRIEIGCHAIMEDWDKYTNEVDRLSLIISEMKRRDIYCKYIRFLDDLERVCYKCIKDIPRWIEAYAFTHPDVQAITARVNIKGEDDADDN